MIHTLEREDVTACMHKRGSLRRARRRAGPRASLIAICKSRGPSHPSIRASRAGSKLEILRRRESASFAQCRVQRCTERENERMNECRMNTGIRL